MGLKIIEGGLSKRKYHEHEVINNIIHRKMEIAKEEVLKIQMYMLENSKNYLYPRALDAFQSFINSDDPKGQKLEYIEDEESIQRIYSPIDGSLLVETSSVTVIPQRELNEQSKYILLYFIDQLIPGIDVRIDEDNSITIVQTSEIISYLGVSLVRYLCEEWIELSAVKSIIPYDLLDFIMYGDVQE